MSDYTPSLMDGQSYYVTGRAQIQRQITGEHAQDITPYSYEFDRMIAQVRAEAFREAADTVLHNAGDPAFVGDRGDYANGYRQGQRDAVRALRRIEKEAGL